MAFTKAQNTSAFFKIGLLGFEGSGKTKTAVKTAIGLIQYMKKRGLPYANKPAFFIDTGTGSDYVRAEFEAAGIPLLVDKTRAFADLAEGVKTAERDGSILIADSVTHFWKELCGSYCRRKAQQLNKQTYRLQLNDWSFLKGDDGWGKMFPADPRDDRAIMRQIVLGEIENLIVIHYPGQTAADKKAKAELLRTHFKACWTEMEKVMPLDRLRAGYDTLHFTLEGAHSKYHQEPAPAINDELPEHSAPPAAQVVAVPADEDDGIPAMFDRRKAKANGAAWAQSDTSYIEMAAK